MATKTKAQDEARPQAGERSKPESYDELFPGRFLKAGLFKGKEVTLRIAEAYQELMPDKKGTIVNSEGERCKKQLIFRVETPTGRKLEQEMAINKTNAIACKIMFGKALRGSAGWEGRFVTFAPKMVEAFGEETEAIRIVGSPEIAADIEKTERVGRSDKTFRLRKTPTPAGVRIAPLPPAPDPAQEEGGDPYEREKAAAAAIEEQEPPESGEPNDIPY